MKFSFLIICLCFYLNIAAQSSTWNAGTTWSAGTLDIHLVPLVLLDGNPRLRLGTEFHPHNRLGYSLEVGVGSSSLNAYRFTNSIWGQDYSFFEIRPEIKWYKKKPGSFEVYYSAELFYVKMTDKLSHQFFYPKGQTELVSFDEASFSKQKFGLQFKLGLKILLWKTISLDLYEGLGMAYRHIEYSELINPVNFDGLIERFWTPPHEHEGDYFLAQLSLGVRIGYVIGRW